MGYTPKHAKPASLRGTALKTPLTGGSVNGRHRAGAGIPGQRIPADDQDHGPVPGPEGVPGPVTPPAAGAGAGAGHAEEAAASETEAGDRPADNQAARAELLMKLVPLQRTPVPES